MILSLRITATLQASIAYFYKDINRLSNENMLNIESYRETRWWKARRSGFNFNIRVMIEAIHGIVVF